MMKYLYCLTIFCLFAYQPLEAQDKGERDQFKEKLKAKRRKQAEDKAKKDALNQALLNQFRQGLTNPDVKIRSLSLAALIRMKNKENSLLIIKTLEDDSPKIRIMVLDYFIKQKNKAHLSALNHISADTEIKVRVKLVEAVLAYTVKGYDTYSLLQNMMEDKQAKVRMAVIEGVNKFTKKSFADRRLFDSIQTAFQDTDSKVKLLAFGFIDRFKLSITHDYLETALSDTQNSIRSIAQEVLGKIKDKRATKLLITTLNDTYVPIRNRAITLLGEQINKDIIRILDNHILGEKDYKLRMLVLKTIASKPSPMVINVISRSLTDSVGKVRIHAATLLAEIQKKVNRK